MSITVDVQINAYGTVEVADTWTDEAIDADPEGFDEAVLAAVPDHMNDLRLSIADAVARLPEVTA